MTVGDEMYLPHSSVWLAALASLDPRQAPVSLCAQLPRRFIIPDTEKAGKARQPRGCEAIVLECDRGSFKFCGNFGAGGLGVFADDVGVDCSLGNGSDGLDSDDVED